MTPIPPGLFPGPVKSRILEALAASSQPVYAADLCEAVFGTRDTPKRDSLRNLVAQMGPRLRAYGYEIRGRNELRVNAYQLVNLLLED